MLPWRADAGQFSDGAATLASGWPRAAAGGEERFRVDERARAVAVQRVAGGDASALQRLIVEYHAAWRVAVEQAGSGDLPARFDPDDILQQAYTAAFAALCPRDDPSAGGVAQRERPGFDNPECFYAWMERIALNALRDEQRACRRQKRDVARECGPALPAGTSYYDLALTLAASDGTPSRILAKRETEAAVMSSLARLRPEQRDVIRLRFLEGLPVAEVATRLEKTEAAVHMLCHRGLKSLRRYLGALTGQRMQS